MKSKALAVAALSFSSSALWAQPSPFQQHQLVDELRAAFRDPALRESWVGEGRELSTARDLLRAEDTQASVLPKKNIHPEDARRLSRAMDLGEADLALSTLEPRERREVVTHAREDLAEGILARYNSRKRWTFKLDEAVEWSNNVTQTPDNEPSISRISGLSSQTRLQYGLEARQYVFGKPSLSLDTGLTRYFKPVLESRNSSSYGLNLRDRMQTTGSNFLSFAQFELALRSDTLVFNGRNIHGFDTMMPRVDLMSRPYKKIARWSELFFYYASAGYESRRYVSRLRYDADSLNKDTQAILLTLMGMNFRKWRTHSSQTTLTLTVRSQDSDSFDMLYDTYSAALAYGFVGTFWTLTPGLSWSHRYQPRYQGQHRNDDSLEESLGLVGKTEDQRWSFGADLKNSNQDSSLSPFKYSAISCGLSIGLAL